MSGHAPFRPLRHILVCDSPRRRCMPVESGLLALLAVAVIKGLTMLAGYLANSNTFPQPLSEADEAKYLARLQRGEEEARSVLIERNLRLVAHIVNCLLYTSDAADE